MVVGGFKYIHLLYTVYVFTVTEETGPILYWERVQHLVASAFNVGIMDNYKL